MQPPLPTLPAASTVALSELGYSSSEADYGDGEEDAFELFFRVDREHRARD